MVSSISDEHLQYLKNLFFACPQVVQNSITIVHNPMQHNLITTYQDTRNVFVLLKGRLQAIEERVVDIPYGFTEIQPINIVGDYELFTDMQGHYVTLKTLEPSTFLQIPSSMYLYWIKSDANALFMRTQMLMKELSIQTQQQRQFLFMDNRTKLIIFLLRVCEQQEEASIYIVNKTREKIAAQIGCSIRTLNRIILSLHTQALLFVHHGKIHITQTQRTMLTIEIKEFDFPTSL